ncbi:unnamed protein product, partial [Polarella glacialis]
MPLKQPVCFAARVERLEFERAQKEEANDEEVMQQGRKIADRILMEYQDMMQSGSTSLTEAVSKGKAVLEELAAEIAEGEERRHFLMKDHEAYEAEMWELTRRQKSVVTILQEYEDKRASAAERQRELMESLKSDLASSRRMRISLDKQHEEHSHKCKQVWSRIETRLQKKLMANCSEMLKLHLKRKLREKAYSDRAFALRKASLENQVKNNEKYLKLRREQLAEARERKDIGQLRALALGAKGLCMHMRLRAAEMTQAGTLAAKEGVVDCWESAIGRYEEEEKEAPNGLLALLAVELDVH